jgi:putative membrane protein
MKKLLRVVLLAIGLALFTWFLLRAGPTEIWHTGSRLGWRAPLVLVPFAAVYFVETLGWHFAFGRRKHRPLRLPGLYRIRWCGEAVNNVIPSATIGGEAVKVYLVHKRGVPGADATASVIIGRTVQTLCQVIFIGLGSAALLHVAGYKPGVRPAMLVVLGLSVALIVLLFVLQAHGIFALVLCLARRLGWSATALERRRDKLVQIDRQVLACYQDDRRHLLFSACAYLGGWLLDTLDVFLVAYLLGVPMQWLQALGIEAFIGVAKLMGFVVPGGLGVQEAGVTLVCRLAGLPEPFAVAYAILRRGRDVAFASLGWLMLYLEETNLGGLRQRIAAESPPSL